MLSNKPLTVLHEDGKSSDGQLAKKFQAINRQDFAQLLTFIEFAADLTIGFVEVNYSQDRDSLIGSLQEHPNCLNIQFLICNFDDPKLRFLRDEIIAQLSKITIEPDKKLVIMIRGVENAIGSSGDYPPILQDLNYIRDAFTTSVPHPILFFLPDYGITRLAQFAPDFWSWRSGLFRFITFYDFKSTKESIVPKTGHFYLTLQTSSVGKERIELLTGLLKDNPITSIKSQQALQHYLNIITQLGIAYRTNKKTLVKSEEYLKEACVLVNDRSSSISVIIQGNVIYELAVTYEKLGDLVSALSYLQKSLELRKNINDFKGTAETLHQIGIIYTKQKEFETALKHLDEALKIEESIENNFGKLETLNQMGILCVEAGNIETAINYYQDALSICDRETFPERWAILINNLAIAYSHGIDGDKAKKLELAISLYQDILQVYTDEVFPEQWATVQNNLAVAYSDRIHGEKEKNLEKAIACYENALQVYTPESFPEKSAIVQNNLATVSQTLKQFYNIYSS